MGSKGIKEEARLLTIERIKVASDNLKISIGSSEYSKDEILKTLENEDNDFTREIIETQLEYLRNMASGAIYQELE